MELTPPISSLHSATEPSLLLQPSTALCLTDYLFADPTCTDCMLAWLPKCSARAGLGCAALVNSLLSHTLLYNVVVESIITAIFKYHAVACDCAAPLLWQIKEFI